MTGTSDPSAGDMHSVLDQLEALGITIDPSVFSAAGVQVQAFSEVTVDALLQALYVRRPGLQERMHRMCELAVSVGSSLGLQSDELEELRRSTELHEIGTIAIPDEILRKPGSLDEPEWSFVRRHTEIGERILGAAPGLLQVARIVRSSHERWDGLGYPDGLAGEAIPRASRIVAVCDAYTAMTSPRPHRRRMTPGEALAELRRFAGTQFDPVAVAVLCGVIEPASPDPER